MRFSDLQRADRRPDGALLIERLPTVEAAASAATPVISDDRQNNGFMAGILQTSPGRRLRASRRSFLRGGLTTAAAATAAGLGGLFGPARRVQAQSSIIGTYPRRLLTWCPPTNRNDNCQPGCGSSPICTDCCTSDGYFRNDPANGYNLYAGGCGSGDIADGWLWRYQGACGNCSTIEYRCSDGYVETDTGPAPFICRAVTECVPLGEGQEPGQPLNDAAQRTNWQPTGRLELASDNGGTVTLTGWIADASGAPVNMRILGDGQIISWGSANLARADVAGSVRGAGPNTGYSVTFPAENGRHEYCVNALSGALSVTIACVTLDVGTGQRIAGGGISPAPQPPAATPVPASNTGDSPDQPTTVETSPDEPRYVLPEVGDLSANPVRGAVQVLRRADASTGFVSGWAGDADGVEPPFVEVTADGETVALTRPDLPRPDVAAALPALGPSTGFATEFPLPADATEVCVRLVGADDGRPVALGCRQLGPSAAAAAEVPSNSRPERSGEVRAAEPVVYHEIDTLDVGPGLVTLAGWAFDPEHRSEPVSVELSAAGARTVITTVEPHPDARATFGIERDMGFRGEIALTPGPHQIVVNAVSGPDIVELDRLEVVVP